MNVFHRFTRASLRHNPNRTLVTVIGIVLSMALVTAVVQGAYSGMSFLRRAEESRVGAFHGYYYGLTEEEAQAARQSDIVEASASWSTVGWAEVRSGNEYKPYLLIRAVSENFSDLVAVHLTAGRLPENDGELLLPDHLAANGGTMYQVGDTLTLEVGRRTLDGLPLDESNYFAPDSGEKLTDTVQRAYTVVGTYRRLDNLLENLGCPGYTALTAGDGQNGDGQGLFFTVKHPGRFYAEMERGAVSDQWVPHTDLLLMYQSVRAENLANFLYGFAGVLIFLIAFGSVALIYNSFAISVSERTRQFGILKSVGATKKQIRRSVLYEAALLGGIGILGGAAVGCLGISVTLWALRDSFAMFSEGTDVQMKLVISPAGMAVAAAVCFLTTMISAWIPARRADRVSAIDAIRQTRDIRVTGKNVKVSPLTKKIFGFEGMMASKNFKRNRKRYRATVVSLFLSVTLFIAASSFCTYLTDLVGAAGSNHVSASLTYHTVGQERSDPDGMRKMFAGVAGVTGCSYADLGDIRPFFPLDTLTAQQRLAAEQMAHRTVDGQETAEVYAFIAFLDDDSFRELCRENGVDPAEFFHRDDPRALFYNRSAGRMFFQDEGVSRWYDREVVETKRLPLTVRLFLEREFEGYTLMEIEGDVYRYYPNEAVEQYYQAVNDGEAERLDPAMVMIKTEEEALETFQLTLQQVIRQPMALQPQDSPTVIYPYSMEEAVLGQGAAERFGQTFFAIQADDHAGAYDAVGRELSRRGMDTARLFDQVAEAENMRLLVTAVRVFSYGFILLISLIAAANVFNTISTNVMLRRRELAMLKSIGLGRRGLRRMMNYECLIYGCKALLWGLPAAVGLTWAIWRIIGGVMDRGFYIPWHSAVIAVGSVFAVVFATMLYAMRLIGKDNPVDALKQENL